MHRRSQSIGNNNETIGANTAPAITKMGKAVSEKWPWTRFVPVACVVFGVSTIAICCAMTIAQGAYIGGVPTPYISDMGRDPPQYYVFVAGLVLCSILFFITVLLHVDHFRMEFFTLKPAQQTHKTAILRARIALYVGAACGFVAPIFLSGLAVFDKRRAVQMHNICASIFFVTAIACAVLHAVAYMFVANLPGTDSDVKGALRLKLAILAVAFVAFLIYMPVGGLLACQKLYTPEGLEDYTGCPAIFTARIICQYITVVCLLLSVGAFYVDLSRETTQNAMHDEGMNLYGSDQQSDSQ